MIKNFIKSLIGRPVPSLVAKTEWYSAIKIKAYQEKRLRKLIHYAYRFIPYYHRLFNEHNLKPQEIQTIEDLMKIPPLTRKLAQENYADLINPRRVVHTHLSSETTGQRMKWASSLEWLELFPLTLWRGFSWAGLRRDHRVVSFHSRVIGEIAKNSLIIREALDESTIDEQLRQIRGFKPDFAYCYASSAYAMAQYLLKRNLRIHLEGIIVTSDQLFPHYIPVIEEAFRCKVFNNYGCNDGGLWGAECQERLGFHQDFERSILEFQDGKMLATDLWNYAMPFIRYENGDTGCWLNVSCPCGRMMPLFSVTGRINDFISTPSKIFSPTTIAQIFKHECFVNIQVIQHTKNEIEILYVNDPAFDESIGKKMINGFIAQLDGVKVRVNQTDFIQKPASEKRRICIRHMDVSHAELDSKIEL